MMVFFYYFLLDKYTPIKIINAPRNCTGVSISLSNNPQKKATIGIKYVTDVAKTGDDICINLKKMILAIPVPTIPSTITNNIECCTSA